MSNKVFDSIRKIADQLCITTPNNIDGIFAEHLLNQISSRIAQQKDFTLSQAADVQLYKGSNEVYINRVEAMSKKLDAALAPYGDRVAQAKRLGTIKR